MNGRTKQGFLWFVALLILFCAKSEAAEPQRVRGAILQTEIHTAPAHGGLTHADVTDAFDKSKKDVQETYAGRIQPGTKMRLQAIVKNIGDVSSAPGQIEIVFGYPSSINREPATIFSTETVNLPAISPGDYQVITFIGLHLWPSLFNFIRDDWVTREYQAIVTVKGRQEITGTRGISYSAYYYEGPIQETAVRVSSADFTPAW